MALVDSLQALLERETASFQLMGEDLALLPGAGLREAAAAYEAQVAELPAGLRARFEAEQAVVLREAHRWLCKYNRSVHTRLRGYLALGRRCSFEYPWPVVAMLGICQVLTGIGRNRRYALLAPVLRRLGSRKLDELVEGTEDVLRRTNRGIFADSVPAVLMALHARELSTRGDRELADALLDGPLPPVMDGESRSLMRGLHDGLAIADPEQRFGALTALTLRHFAREQAIFTYQMGPVGAPVGLRSVPAPRIERTLLGGRRVVFKSFRLPRGFDLRDHAARVAAFGQAFVSSVTADQADYRAAVAYVERRFGKSD